MECQRHSVYPIQIITNGQHGWVEQSAQVTKFSRPYAHIYTYIFGVCVCVCVCRDFYRSCTRGYCLLLVLKLFRHVQRTANLLMRKPKTKRKYFGRYVVVCSIYDLLSFWFLFNPMIIGWQTLFYKYTLHHAPTYPFRKRPSTIWSTVCHNGLILWKLFHVVIPTWNSRLFVMLLGKR